MKIHHKKMSGTAFPCALKMFGSIMASCSLFAFAPLAADAATISGDSTTILRVRESIQDKTLVPIYEYLNLSVTEFGQDKALSFYLGGWGRADLADKSGQDRTNGDLRYGYLSYRSNKNNLLVNAGRQFVVEGVAAEKLDGLYLRTDLAAGFTAAAFVGSPVVTEPNFDGGDLIYGGRLGHGSSNYSVGVSALQSFAGGDRFRQEEGVDLWLRPMQQIDVAGRSSYNSITDGWMEHAYTASYAPLDKLRFSVSLSQVNYQDYFYHVTTSALSLTNGILDPNEEVFSLGGSIGYNPVKNVNLSADYKNFDYKVMGNADYFGGNVSFSLPDALAAGLSYHRMAGSSERLKYDEYRVYATKQLGKADFTLDFIDINYDASINGIKNTYSVAAAAGYTFAPSVRVAADVDYMRNPEFDNEVRGLVKVTYAFDSERRGK